MGRRVEQGRALPTTLACVVASEVRGGGWIPGMGMISRDVEGYTPVRGSLKAPAGISNVSA